MIEILTLMRAIVASVSMLLICDQWAWSEPIGLTAVVTSDLSSPVYITDAGDQSARLFIVEQGGKIKILSNGQLLSTPFLDISSKISSGGERGLLGLAFHPKFDTNRKFYVYYTGPNGDVTVVEYKASSSDANRADSTTARRILRIGHSAAGNHNGGCLQFGPDGFLYIGTGDGGGAGDPLGNGQKRRSLLGKILRIDINSGRYRIPRNNPFVGKSGIRREIWAYGLRNPWRFSFDPSTGHIFAGDVGQGSVEEVDIISRGRNYGWNKLEGSQCFNPSSGCSRSGTTLPISEYQHDEGQAITGGYLYRGSAIPSLRGKYIFGDFASGTIWTLTKQANSSWTRNVLLTTSYMISSFGRDADGEIYLVDYAGGIYQFTQ